MSKFNFMPRLESITFKQLRALAAVVERGTISLAADQLGLTAPAVHTQLRSLEDNLGCALLDRSDPRSPGLTAEGKLLFEAYQSMQATLATSLERIASLNDGYKGSVILGVASTGKYFAPKLVAELRRALPDVDIQLKVGNRDMLLEALSQRTIELLIMGRPSREPAVIARELGDHPHIFIAAPEHHLARLERVAVTDLMEETFLCREQGSGSRILMERYLDRIGDGQPYKTSTMGSNETIKQAVMAGLGIAMISQHTVTDELDSGRLVQLRTEIPAVVRQWYLMYAKDLALTPTLRAVHDYILAQKGAFLPRLKGAPESRQERAA